MPAPQPIRAAPDDARPGQAGSAASVNPTPSMCWAALVFRASRWPAGGMVAEGVSPVPSSAHLLKCPRCSLPLAPGASCRGCGLAPSVDGVMDFVAGSRTTKLDDLDYDAFYDVSPERADRDFATVKRLLGERLLGERLLGERLLGERLLG